jgi:integrase
MKKNDWHPKIIEDYLEKYYKNVDSRDTARVYLKSFFTTTNEDPKQFIKKSKEEITEIVWDFAKHIENRPPKTQASMLSFIKKFLVRNKNAIDEVEFEDIQIRNNLKKKVKAIAKKKTPTLQELKKILSYTTSIKAKSLFVFCASSGCRIDEALKLTFDDIDLEKRQVELRDDVPKFSEPRYTFFTPEAKELLDLWIPERKKMLQIRYKRSKYLRDKLERQGYEVKKITQKSPYKINGKEYPNNKWKIFKNGKELSKDEIIKLDNRIWPFDYVNASRMWINLLDKAGHPFNEMDNNPKLKFKKFLYNEHCLRRFWFTQLASDRANEEYVNFIGGHTSELSKTYKDFESEIMRRKIKEEYENHVGCLSIFEAQPDLTGIHEQLNEKDKRIKDLEARMEKFEELLEQKKHLLNLYENQLKNGNKK